MQPNTLASATSASFFDLEIEQDEQKYSKSYYDEVNSKLIANLLSNNDNNTDDLVLVLPEDPTVVITVIVQSLLGLLQYDVDSGSSTTLRNIKPGDNVGLVSGRQMHPAVYLGKEILDGKEFYCIQEPKDIITKIPPGREWRIQPYSSAVALSPSRKSTIYGMALEQILKLPAGGIKALQKSKMLVVTSDKSNLIETLRSINIGGDPIEAVFPIANYKTKDDWQYVGSFGINNLKQEPIIGLVSNFDTAVDIALSDPTYTLIICDSASKIRAHYGDIERLNSDATARKVIALLRTSDEEEITTLQNMGLSTWIWKRDDFSYKNFVNLDTELNGAFGKHNQILKSFTGPGPIYREVKLPEEINNTIEKTYRNLYSLSKNVHAVPDAGMLIRWGISILNSWLQLPVTARYYDEYISRNPLLHGKELATRFGAFSNRLRDSYGLLIPASSIDQCESLIKSMNEIFEYFSIHNPKNDFLNQIIETFPEENLNFYFGDSIHTSVFNETKGKHNVRGRNIEQIDLLPSPQAIITGWSSRKNVARTFLAPAQTITYIVYKKEMESVQYVYRTHPSSPHSNYDLKTRQLIDHADSATEIKQIQTLPDEEPQNSGNIQSIIDNISRRIGASTDFNPELMMSFNKDERLVSARAITLDDGAIVFVDDGHLLDRIDREAKRIRRIAVDKICPGDELVFASSNRSMFEELLSILQASAEYKMHLTRATLWKSTLLNYIEDTHITDSELVKLFEMAECPRNLQTIRSWINGKVIGPVKDNYAAVHAIAKITGSHELASKTDSVIQACKLVHALHVRTGWLLVRNIINSAIVADDSELNQETKDRLAAYSASAQIRTVRAVSDKTYNVPESQIGRLENTLA